jgi:hypothetical protein
MASKSNKTKKALERSIQRDVDSIRRGARDELTPVARDYLNALVDPRNAKLCGIPTAVGGYPGATQVLRYSDVIEVSTGTTGWGFISLRPASVGSLPSQVSGPFSNTANVFWSDVGFVGSTLPSVGATLPTGTSKAGWTSSPAALPGFVLEDADFGYRCVGASIEIFPESSFADQNGTIGLLEIPGHTLINVAGSKNMNQLLSLSQTRVLRGTQTGAQSEKIVLNFHPRSHSEAGLNQNDFEFVFPGTGVSPTGVVPPIDCLLILLKATSGTMFQCRITAMYEAIGVKTTGRRARLVDTRGMDLIMNSIASKTASGYVGKPHHIYEGYLSAAWRTAKKLGGWVKAHERELADGAGRAMSTIAGLL